MLILLNLQLKNIMNILTIIKRCSKRFLNDFTYMMVIIILLGLPWPFDFYSANLEKDNSPDKIIKTNSFSKENQGIENIIGNTVFEKVDLVNAIGWNSMKRIDLSIGEDSLNTFKVLRSDPLASLGALSRELFSSMKLSKSMYNALDIIGYFIMVTLLLFLCRLLYKAIHRFNSWGVDLILSGVALLICQNISLHENSWLIPILAFTYIYILICILILILTACTGNTKIYEKFLPISHVFISLFSGSLIILCLMFNY